MLHKLRAIVLHSIRYGESGIITQTYTSSHGRLSFLIHGVRKKKSKFRAYLFQPLSILDMEAYIKDNRDLQKIKDVRPAFTLNQLHSDIRRSTIAVFIGEVLTRALRESDVNHPLFHYLENAVQMLDIGKQGISNFHLVFLMQLTKFTGIFPVNHEEFRAYRTQSGFNLEELLEYSLSDIAELRIDSLTRNEVLDQLLLFYRTHMEGFGNVKSLEILREVFQ